MLRTIFNRCWALITRQSVLLVPVAPIGQMQASTLGNLNVTVPRGLSYGTHQAGHRANTKNLNNNCRPIVRKMFHCSHAVDAEIKDISTNSVYTIIDGVL